MVPVLGYSITIPLPSWKLWGRKDREGLFNNSYPPMDPEVPTTSTPNLTMGKTVDMCVWASADGVMKSQKRCDYASSAEPGFDSKGCICHAILNEGERCKVEFNQPSYWLYSVPNLLVFQHLVTLYLGGFCCKGNE